MKLARKIIDSLMFVSSALLLGIVSLVALPLTAKENVHKRRATRKSRAFLAEKKRALAYYNVLTSAYDMLNPYLYTSHMRNEVVKLINHEKLLRVLDVGCGTGYTTEAILGLDNVCDVVGIDQNHKQLQRAEQKLRMERARFSLSRGDVENLPFLDESFDAVVSVGAVEYFPEPEKALKEMVRVVKHNGRVVVGGPEFDSFRKIMLHRIFYTPSKKDFEDMFYLTELQNVKVTLTGVDTFFGTSKYVVVVAGTKD